MIATKKPFIIAGDEIATVIQAQPEYYVLELVHEDDGSIKTFDKSPIIAWAVGVSSALYPLTTEPVPRWEDPVLAPNGKVMAAFGQVYADYIEWFAEARQIALEEAKAQGAARGQGACGKASQIVAAKGR